MFRLAHDLLLGLCQRGTDDWFDQIVFDNDLTSPAPGATIDSYARSL